MKFHITTLGCPKNTVDSEMMAELLTEAGHVPADTPERADVLVVNTCAFVQSAREQSFAALREAAAQKRRGQRLVVAGCMAQRYGEDLHSVSGIDAIIGTRLWPEIVALFERMGRESGPVCWIEQKSNLVASVRRRRSVGATAYLKIADGCDASCGFCAIPLIKGPQRSKPLVEVVREARELVATGVQEIVLIAQDTTAYGRDRHENDALPGLLGAIIEAAPDLAWLRILYTYPQHITAQLIETMVNISQVCHYIDLPLQHGHPDVLRRMRRPHDVAATYALIDRLRDAIPDVALRSTFIVGYPGETEAQFQSLVDFMRAIAFDKVGIFGYSVEDGTPAARLPDRVPAEVIAERYDRAMLVQQEISLQRNRDQVGRRLPILVDGAGDGISVGRSYREAPEIDGFVLVPGEMPVGKFATVRIVEAQEYDLVAQVVA